MTDSSLTDATQIRALIDRFEELSAPLEPRIEAPTPRPKTKPKSKPRPAKQRTRRLALHVRTGSEQPFTGPEEWALLREDCGGQAIRGNFNSWMVTCPAHDDRTPSLHLSPGDSQPVVFHCHGNCPDEQVLKADGLTWADVRYPDPDRKVPSRAPISALRLPDIDLKPQYVNTDLLTNAVLRGDLSLESFRKGRRAWLQELEDGGQAERGSHELVLPKGAGKTMWRVAADLVDLANRRIRNGERRPIPYSQGFGAARLDIDPGSVGRALRSLERHDLLVNVGRLPYRGWAGAPSLWALRVQNVLPDASCSVEGADGVAGIDLDPITAR